MFYGLSFVSRMSLSLYGVKKLFSSSPSPSHFATNNNFVSFYAVAQLMLVAINLLFPV